MPQLDTSTFVSQIFWLIITFLSLWFLMSVFIIPKIAQTIEERQNKIGNDIQKAEQINQRALETLEKYEQSLAKAKDSAALKIKEEKQRMEAEIEFKKAELKHVLDEKIAQNTHTLLLERTQTLEMADHVAFEMAKLIASKLNLPDILPQKDNNID